MAKTKTVYRTKKAAKRRRSTGGFGGFNLNKILKTVMGGAVVGLVSKFSGNIPYVGTSLPYFAGGFLLKNDVLMTLGGVTLGTQLVNQFAGGIGGTTSGNFWEV